MRNAVSLPMFYSIDYKSLATKPTTDFRNLLWLSHHERGTIKVVSRAGIELIVVCEKIHSPCHRGLLSPYDL